MIERCVTSWGYRNGQCAVWLDGEILCDRPAGHYPETYHRGHASNGLRGVDGRWGWVDYKEVDGVLVMVNTNIGSLFPEVGKELHVPYVAKHRAGGES